ncbi:NmrA/HSCARG family protein [Nocardia altamirensis]|uniref:NmrA/HSCARG family protein n=1 Tax=Nocardia altamirensis TaxID=472158 RepID=UPI0008401A74|nr:NmrA/HSCARG family protein [Nocardia altamirensis]
MTRRSDNVILVVGATGRQGRATAAELLADGWQVRALTRNPESPTAQALRTVGAELIVGDLDDRASLEVAVKGAHGVFHAQAVRGFASEFVVAEEIRQGKNLIDAAVAADVEHLVYSAAADLDVEHDNGIHSYLAKREIERYLHESGLPATVLLATMFMENIGTSGPINGRANGTFSHVFSPDQPVQLFAVQDIGAFATVAFGNPYWYVGTRLTLAGDELSMTQVATAISAATHRWIEYRQLPPTALDSRDTWHPNLDAAGRTRRADIKALRGMYPELQTFDTWLRGNTGIFQPDLRCA